MKSRITLWGFSLGYREAVDLAPRVLVELLGMPVYLRWVPRLIPDG